MKFLFLPLSILCFVGCQGTPEARPSTQSTAANAEASTQDSDVKIELDNSDNKELDQADKKVGDEKAKEIPGGESSAEANSPEVIAAVKFAVEQINLTRASSSELPFKLIKIVSVKSQIVAGVKYKANINLTAKDSMVELYQVVVYKDLTGSMKLELAVPLPDCDLPLPI